MAVVKVEKNTYTVDSLYQWDQNQVLEIRGLSMPAVPEIHYTNDIMVRAVSRSATMDAAGVIRAEIPNAMLQTSAAIRAMVCIRESGGVFKTYYTIRIPVKARPQPADYTITTDQDLYSFLELENLVYTSVEHMEKENAAAAAKATAAAETANAAKQVAEEAAATANGIAGTAQAAQTAAAEALAAATEAKDSVDGKAEVTRTAATLTAESWIGDAAPFTQTVTVAGILETDAPHIAPVYSSDLSTKLAEKEAWAMVCEAEAAPGVVEFICFEEKPSVPINIQIEVVR